MRKQRNKDEIARLLKEFDRELAKGLPIADICRKAGIAQATAAECPRRHPPSRGGCPCDNRSRGPSSPEPMDRSAPRAARGSSPMPARIERRPRGPAPPRPRHS